MPKRHQAGHPSPVSWHQGQALAHPGKPVVEGQILERLALFGHEKGVRQAIVVQGSAPLTVVAEPLRRTGMERHDAGFMKLRLEDVQLRWRKIQLNLINL
jgi:hypothetical protein